LPELAIVVQALADVIGRLECAAQTPVVQQLTARAMGFRWVVARWETPSVCVPSEDERSWVLKRVLDLQIELMKAGYESPELDS